MKKSFLPLLLGFSLAGCSVMENKVQMADLAQGPTNFIVDQTAPDDYPGYMAAEGNIYSCRYGIHHQSNDEFSPPKVQVLAGLLAKHLPSITKRKVVVSRFDVYYNHRLKMLSTAGAAIGGAVGATAQSAANQNRSVYTFDKLIIDTNPDASRYPGQNQVGCDDKKEGEYYPAEISGGHDVVVTWLKFTVDGQPYHFRTFYQFQPANKAEISAGIAEAMRLSVQGTALRIK